MYRHDHSRKVVGIYFVVKRALDIIVALTLLAVWALPMLLVALIIVAQDGGSPLFKQTRVGRFGRPFSILKFRTMVVDAQARGGFRTDAGDPRITAFGHFLRSSSIDETPQLLNVLKGDMSLIGPRPDVPAQQGSYSVPEWVARHAIRPGITGLAQACDRSLLTPQKRTALDLEYVDRLGPILDAQIIALTIRQMLKGGST